MVTHVLRPTGNESIQPGPIVRKQCSGSILKTREVSRQCRHETVGALLCFASFVFVTMNAPCFLDQFAQSHGRTAGLCRQPFPMPW